MYQDIFSFLIIIFFKKLVGSPLVSSEPYNPNSLSTYQSNTPSNLLRRISLKKISRAKGLRAPTESLTEEPIDTLGSNDELSQQAVDIPQPTGVYRQSEGEPSFKNSAKIVHGFGPSGLAFLPLAKKGKIC